MKQRMSLDNILERAVSRLRRSDVHQNSVCVNNNVAYYACIVMIFVVTLCPDNNNQEMGACFP